MGVFITNFDAKDIETIQNGGENKADVTPITCGNPTEEEANAAFEKMFEESEKAFQKLFEEVWKK